ncbi:hypothetical protein Tco_0683039 [Tanacetum coccineum]|uniref:Uncharacterized protein n=1 Tax=Tanacetum coccineum TaxID=301880 RepID=A0ABQ4XT31_9ASTR
MRRPEIEIKPQQPEEPEPTIEDEFQDLHLNVPVLEVLAYAPIYNAILDKYVESLELGKNRSAFVQGEIPAKMKYPGLFTLPCAQNPLIMLRKGLLRTANFPENGKSLVIFDEKKLESS